MSEPEAMSILISIISFLSLHKALDLFSRESMFKQ